MENSYVTAKQVMKKEVSGASNFTKSSVTGASKSAHE
jgi:hypothetical protein